MSEETKEKLFVVECAVGYVIAMVALWAMSSGGFP